MKFEIRATDLILLVLIGALGGFTYHRLNQMERLFVSIAERGAAQPTAEKGGREPVDPYVSKQVKNTVMKNAPQVLACYKSFLESNKAAGATQQGNLTLDWQIDADGKVQNPEVVRTEIDNKEFHGCLKKQIAAWQFPPPPYGATKYVDHTFQFKDKPDEAPAAPPAPAAVSKSAKKS